MALNGMIMYHTKVHIGMTSLALEENWVQHEENWVQHETKRSSHKQFQTSLGIAYD